MSLEQILYLLKGTGWTLTLAVIAFCGGAVLGLLIALARVSSSRVLRILSKGYVRLVQGIPLPVLMFVCYFGMAVRGYDVPAVVAAGTSLVLFAGAYLGEIWRGAIEAVPKQQWEAAASLGLGRGHRMADVILPQALRIATPPTVGFMVQIVKNTSYAVVIGFIELTQSARIVNNAVYKPFLIFTIVGAIYFAICHPLSRLSRTLERRLRTRGA